jgi:hypothetical protein
VGAEIGEDDSVARREGLGDWEPKFVVGGKRVKEEDRRSVAKSPIDDFGVVGLEAVVGDWRHVRIRT